MPGDILVTDAAAEAIYQLITASAGLPGAWDDGKWCSAAVCRSSDIESSSIVEYRDRHRLQRVVRSAEKVIGCSLPSIQDLYVSRTLRRAGRITADPSHPGHGLFEPLPSGRRLRSIWTRTSRHKNSFFPSAVGLLNCN